MAQRGVNKVILIGNAGGDAEQRYFPDGGGVTNLTIATSETWKDRQTGEEKEKTEWHRLVFRDRGNYKLSDYAAEILKGAKIFVEGKLVTRKWQGQDGQDRYTTEIMVNEFQHLSPRQQGGQGAAPGGGAPPAQTPGQAAGPAPGAAPGRQPPPPVMDTFDDDIPF